MSTSTFYSRSHPKRNKWITPDKGEDSDLEVDDNTLEAALDDDTLDPNFQLDISDDELTPTSSGSVNRVRPQNMPDTESDEEDDDQERTPAVQPHKKAKTTAKERTWNKEDINLPALPAFSHTAPPDTRSPIEYFQDLFTVDLLEDIVFQTNLFTRQRNVNTTFHTNTK
ncbi:uncharacterized protein LOC143025206 [Oratosquilla oratoria]|uniref:uncharacterized protein LOC143025206 n=1 Tax=Oratosquilla oratoria TaxID=337810 RepID=UPI003F7698E1